MNSRILPRLTAPSILFALALASTVRGQWVEDSIDVGGAWVGSLAYNPLMDVVYGGSQLRDGTFFVIDCATNQVIESWPIQWTMGMDYDSIDHRLYCAYGLDAESLAVIDGRTHQRIKAIPLEWARLCVWDGMRDRLYVSCPERNVVAVFDCTRDSLICEIPVGNYPMKMFLNGRHRKLYVLNYDEVSVSVVDLWSNQVITTIPLHSEVAPQSACYVPSADKFYCDSYQDVTVIDGTSDSVVNVIPLPAGTSAYSIGHRSDPPLVFIGVNSSRAGSLFVVTPDLDSVVSRVEVGDGPQALFWGAASNRLYCASAYCRNVSVLAGDGSEVERVLAVGDAPYVLSYSQQSSRLYVGHLNTRYVYVIRDEVGGIAEGASTRLPRGAAAVVRNTLETDSPGMLLDVSGRVVMKLLRGENDIRRLAPGVYAVTTARGVTGRVVKVR